MAISREHIKAARSVLGLGVRELGDLAGVSPNTVTRFETGGDLRVSTLNKIQMVLEEAGIEFIDSDPPGIRWRSKK